MPIDESDFHRIDLNLLVVFSALMRERSVSAAGRRLYLGQPAVSASLKRLRELFADELFVRTAKGMEPTSRALEVADRIGPSLMAIHDAISEPAGFDPATATQTFRLGTTDSVEVAMLPTLMPRLRTQAPGCRLVIRPPTGNRSAVDALQEDEIDFAIAPAADTPSWIHKELLFETHFVAMFDTRRLGYSPPLTLDQYLAHPHLLTTFSGDLHGFIDDKLTELRRTRNVVFGSAHFGTLPLVLTQTDALATLPGESAAVYVEQFGLTTSPLPFALEPLQVSLLWSARTTSDPALSWFRALLLSTARELL